MVNYYFGLSCDLDLDPSKIIYSLLITQLPGVSHPPAPLPSAQNVHLLTYIIRRASHLQNESKGSIFCWFSMVPTVKVKVEDKN